MTHHLTQIRASGLTEDMRACIDACNESHDVCLATVQYCLEKGGEHANADHIRALLDCAEACRTSADFMLRGSDLHARTCGVCAEACERCAESCDALGEDATMQACADACRRSAESCRGMAEHGEHVTHAA